MLTIQGGVAAFERELIRTRTGEGRERAKARGVKVGRTPKLTPHQHDEVRDQIQGMVDAVMLSQDGDNFRIPPPKAVLWRGSLIVNLHS